MSSEDDDLHKLLEQLDREAERPDCEFLWHKRRLETDLIPNAESKLQKERPFLYNWEIAADEREIAAYKKELVEMQDMGWQKWLESNSLHMQIKASHDEEEEWQNNPRLKIREWCQWARRTADRIYRVTKKQNENNTGLKCPRCARRFAKDKSSKQGYIMSSFVYYNFKKNLWRVSGCYGSVIADNDEFVVSDIVKMGSLLRIGAVICDFCLVELVEMGALRPVFLSGHIIDSDMFTEFRGSGPRSTWIQ